MNEKRDMKQITTRIPSELKRRIERYCLQLDKPDANRITLTDFFTKSAEEYLSKREEPCS